MTTEDFFNTLNKHQDKSLLFQYMPGQLVGANYHITEVKHITVDAVDCGARTDAWKETKVWPQLEPCILKHYTTKRGTEGSATKVLAHFQLGYFTTF